MRLTFSRNNFYKRDVSTRVIMHCSPNTSGLGTFTKVEGNAQDSVFVSTTCVQSNLSYNEISLMTRYLETFGCFIASLLIMVMSEKEKIFQSR